MPAPDYRDVRVPQPRDLIAHSEADLGRPCRFLDGWIHHRRNGWAVVAIYETVMTPDETLGDMHQIRYIVQTSGGNRVGGVVSSWFQQPEEDS